MIHYLQNCQSSTPIGMLPNIINHNNQAIQQEFNWIFDTSLNRLTKSVYAPTGSVKSHFGEFVNLSVEYITIKNIDSVKATLDQAVTEILIDKGESHNILKDRFTPADESLFIDTQYCHDAGVIAYDPNRSVKTVISAQSEKILTNTTDIQNVSSKVSSVSGNIYLHDIEINNINSKLSIYDTSILNNENNIIEVNNTISDISTKLSYTDERITTTEELINTHHDILTLDIAYERGIMDPADCYAWYTQQQGINNCTMQATYNLIGDYCVLSVTDLHLINGWVSMFYSLPVAAVNTTTTLVQSNSSNSANLQTIVCTTEFRTESNKTYPVMHLHVAGGINQGLKDAVISFTLVYKYK